MNMKSWKTTTAGAATIFIVVAAAFKQLVDGDPSTNPNYNVDIPLIVSGIVGLFARDNNVTSEQAGAGAVE